MKFPSDAVSQLPTGTVAFLFTDIQDSTLSWEREPEKMAEALEIHNQVLKKAIQDNGGVIYGALYAELAAENK